MCLINFTVSVWIAVEHQRVQQLLFHFLVPALNGSVPQRPPHNTLHLSVRAGRAQGPTCPEGPNTKLSAPSSSSSAASVTAEEEKPLIWYQERNENKHWLINHHADIRCCWFVLITSKQKSLEHNKILQPAALWLTGWNDVTTFSHEFIT